MASFWSLLSFVKMRQGYCLFSLKHPSSFLFLVPRHSSSFQVSAIQIIVYCITEGSHWLPSFSLGEFMK